MQAPLIGQTVLEKLRSLLTISSGEDVKSQKSAVSLARILAVHLLLTKL